MVSIGTLLRREPAPLLGIDVSTNALRLVELQRDRSGQWAVLHCAVEPLERGWIKDGNLEQFDQVAAALKRLVQKSGSKTRNAALALPGSAVITKKINLPAGLSDDELELQVESEAAQYIPFPLAEVSLDFGVIGPAPKLPDFIEVLLVASRKEKVSDRQGLAEAAGLVPVLLDIESFASRLAATRVIEALPNRGQNMLIALFELGSLNSGLQVIRNEDMVYEREQNFGGSQLTAWIARHYSIPPEEAESKKKSAALPPDYQEAVVAPYLNQLGQDIGRALQFFFTSTPHNKVDYVLLSGGAAAVPGLEVAVMNQTSFPCKVINPFEGMALPAAVASGKGLDSGTAFLVATGLAMRRYST
ncbi:MAG: pilus assembly protein PilM [Betaproteobacteria bacterium]|nr:pilus assembly protein PilM [Betaproteobacteria bacterium]